MPRFVTMMLGWDDSDQLGAGDSTPVHSTELSSLAPGLDTCWTLHCGTFRETRRTFVSVAKISTFADILCLSDRLERVVDTYLTQFSLRKASGAIRKY